MDTEKKQPDKPLRTDPRARLAYFNEILARGGDFLDDAESPPVNDDLLRRYLADATSEEENSTIDSYLDRYRPWVEALQSIDEKLAHSRSTDHSP